MVATSSRKRVALAVRIGIEKDNDLVSRRRETALQRARLAVIFLPQQTDPRIVRGDALRLPLRFRSRRTIIDHNHFQLAFVIRSRAANARVLAITFSSLYAAITTLIGSGEIRRRGSRRNREASQITINVRITTSAVATIMNAQRNSSTA